MTALAKAIRWVRADWTAGLLAGLLFMFLSPDLSKAPRTILLARSLAALSVGFFAWLFFWAITRGPKKYADLSSRHKSFASEWLLQTCIALLILGSWVAGQWPGFFIYDSYTVLNSVAKFQLFEWASSLYSLFILSLQQLSRHPGFVAVVQTVGISVATGFIFSLPTALSGNSWLWRLLLLAFLLNPLNGGMTISFNRDILFSWCHLGCALFLPWYRIFRWEKREPSRLLICGYGLWVVCTAKLRLETAFTTLLLPFLLNRICLWNKQAVALFIGSCLVFGILLFQWMPSWTGTFPLQPSYSLTAFFNPLSQMIRHPYKTDNRAADNKLIDRFFDYSILKKNYDPYGIPAIQSALRAELSTSDVQVLRTLFLKMVWQNPGIFLKNRWNMFKAMNGFFPHTYYVSDDLTADYPDAIQSRHDLGIKKAPLWDWLHDRQFMFLGPLVFDQNAPAQKIAASNGIGLFVLFLALCLFPIAPGTAAAALFLVSRLGIVFFTAPAAQFKYVYGIFLFGFFAPVFFWMEISSLRAAEKWLSWRFLLERPK